MKRKHIVVNGASRMNECAEFIKSKFVVPDGQRPKFKGYACADTKCNEQGRGDHQRSDRA